MNHTNRAADKVIPVREVSRLHSCIHLTWLTSHTYRKYAGHDAVLQAPYEAR